MSDLCLLVIGLLAQRQAQEGQVAPPSTLHTHIASAVESGVSRWCDSPKQVAKVGLSTVEMHQPEFSASAPVRSVQSIQPQSSQFQSVQAQSVQAQSVQAQSVQPESKFASDQLQSILQTLRETRSAPGASPEFRSKFQARIASAQSNLQAASQPSPPLRQFIDRIIHQLAITPPADASTEATPSPAPAPENATFIPVAPTRPLTGSQLFQQRLAALRAGKSYVRLPVNSFQDEWIQASEQPTYEQWVRLLQLEAAAMAQGQGTGRLSVLIGDSLALWFPPELMSRDRFWLNQGISGETTEHTLRRISAIQDTNPDTIHVMVGINDLRRGATDAEVVGNLRQIMRQLRYNHPDAQIIVHSILPTRLASLPTDRIRRLNYMIANATEQEGVKFLNLHYAFNDEFGILRQDLTTDGIHLNPRGYETWGTAIASIF